MSNDIEPADNLAVDLSKIGKYGKFLQIKKFVNVDDPTDIRLEINHPFIFPFLFTNTDTLTKENYVKSDGNPACNRMLNYLDKHISAEVERKLQDKRNELTREMRKELGYEKLAERVYGKRNQRR